MKTPMFSIIYTRFVRGSAVCMNTYMLASKSVIKFGYFLNVGTDNDDSYILFIYMQTAESLFICFLVL